MCFFSDDPYIMIAEVNSAECPNARAAILYALIRYGMDANVYIGRLQEFNRIVSTEFSKVLSIFDARVGTQLPLQISVKLQYADVLAQRIQHLIDTHDTVMALYIDDAFKRSFLHLQYFQFSILVFELFEAVAVLENLLLSYEHKDNGDRSTAAFSNKQSITDLANGIEGYLLQQAGDSRWVGVPSLTIRQTRICLQRYTMDSERVVLDWYLKNSTGVFSELLKEYQLWQHSNRNEAIEFFDNE